MYNFFFFVSSVFVVLNISIDVLLSIMLVLSSFVRSSFVTHHYYQAEHMYNNSRVRTQLLITFLDSESKKKLYGSLHRGAT